jgi:GMP synthase-like glutamine amidotransferase
MMLLTLAKGICFGHQIIAMALGGTCVPNGGVWEVGVVDVTLTQAGKELFATDNETLVRAPPGNPFVIPLNLPTLIGYSANAP